MSELRDALYDGGGKTFTKEGTAKLVELLTTCEAELRIEQENIVVEVTEENGTAFPIVKVKLSHVIASVVEGLTSFAEVDLYLARCEMYSLAALLKEGAEFVEKTARGLDPDKWPDAVDAGMTRPIPIDQDYPEYPRLQSDDDESDEQEEATKSSP